MKRKKILGIIIFAIIFFSVILLLFAKNIQKISFVKNVEHIISEDVATMNEETSNLVLTTKVNLEAANGHGGVDLDWSSYDPTGKVFKAFQKKEGSEEYESISTVDFYNEIEPVKVLNIYPTTNAYGHSIPNATFTYDDRTTKVLPLSASLKVWMEGGTINGIAYETYGKNPKTQQKILDIKQVTSIAFNNNPEMIWDYDVIAFGIWNCNGGPIDQPTQKSLNEIEKYIKAGYGVLTGHDSIGYVFSNTGLSTLRKYFNIEIGYYFETAKPINLLDYNTCWGYGSTVVQIDKAGALTNFPYELPLGAKLKIPVTTSNSQAAKGNVWMSFVDGQDNYLGSYGSVNNYYNAGGKGNPQYYLTTWNNTAMIQTGESDCASTSDERKVFANTLFYLAQISKSTNTTDNSSQDLKAPEAPEIKTRLKDSKIEISYNSKDNGSTYSFYVESYDEKDSSVCIDKSNECTETVTTGTKGYYYIIDSNSANTDFDISTSTYIEGESSIVEISNNGKYIHMKAIDVAGNISDPSVVQIEAVEKLELTSKVNLKLAEGKGAVELDWKGYTIANRYFVIYRKEENAENFEKIVTLEDKLCADEYIDILGNDLAKPTAPEVSIGTNEGEIQINLSSEDNGTTYTYYIESYDIITNLLIETSNTQSVKI